ncbi:MAG: hypothetical protein WCV90_07350 [Candidatus Woesearchaeota archaeon]|jgi:hypothetical protein
MTTQMELTQLVERYAKMNGPQIEGSVDGRSINYRPTCSLVEGREKVLEQVTIVKEGGRFYFCKERNTFLEAKVSDTSKGTEPTLALDYQLKPEERVLVWGTPQPSQITDTRNALGETYAKVLKVLKVEEVLRDYISKHGAAEIITSF